MSGDPSAVSQLPVSALNVNLRLEKLERDLSEHRDRFPGHTIIAGFYQYTRPATNEVRTIIWADSNKTRKVYEEFTVSDPTDTSHIKYKTVAYYDVQGKLFKSFIFRNYEYDTTIEGQITAYEALEANRS